MADIKQRFGKRLRQLREERGISQEALADAAGVSYQTISNIERGLNGPRFAVLEKIARKLKVKEKELFEF